MSVQFDDSEVWLPLGESTQLTAVILPENCPHDKITWESSEPSVATVDENGLVTAVSEGWTNIIARGEAPEGAFPVLASCKVTVYNFVPTGYQITFDPMGGECPVPYQYTVEYEGVPNTLLSYPPAEREGYTFLGWFLEPEGGEPLGDFYPFQGDTTLYAHWEEITTPPDDGCDGGDD